MTFALVLAATATLAGAAGALAGKEPPVVKFGAVECIGVRAEVDIETTAKGRWTYIQYKKEVTTAAKHSVSSVVDARMDAKKDDRLFGLSPSEVADSAVTTFRVILADRNYDSWNEHQESDEFVKEATCSLSPED